MRSGYHNGFVMDGDRFIGINLGADYCAEHEWGIKVLRRYFGIISESEDGTPIIGLDRRRVRQVPDGLRFFDYRSKYKLFCLTYDPHYKYAAERLGPFHVPDELHYHDKDDLGTAWDEDSFGILTRQGKMLGELYEAIKAMDALIFLGGGGVFQNSGLHILIASRIPSEQAQQAYDLDMDGIRLKAADNATGIREVLESAKKTYFALSPRWIMEDFKSRSQYPVMYWLNPMEQSLHNFGWYTVEDLKLWAEDKGPVIKEIG